MAISADGESIRVSLDFLKEIVEDLKTNPEKKEWTRTSLGGHVQTAKRVSFPHTINRGPGENGSGSPYEGIDFSWDEWD